jgi:hypothetical protein
LSHAAIRLTQLHKLSFLPQVTRHLDSAYMRGSRAGAAAMNANDKPSQDKTKPKSSPKIQGEGDYESTRRFDADAKRFLKGAAELKKAEEIGRSHSADAKKSDAEAGGPTNSE